MPGEEAWVGGGPRHGNAGEGTAFARVPVRDHRATPVLSGALPVRIAVDRRTIHRGLMLLLTWRNNSRRASLGAQIAPWGRRIVEAAGCVLRCGRILALSAGGAHGKTANMFKPRIQAAHLRAPAAPRTGRSLGSRGQSR